MSPRRWIMAAMVAASLISLIEALRVTRRAARAMEMVSNGE